MRQAKERDEAAIQILPKKSSSTSVRQLEKVMPGAKVAYDCLCYQVHMSAPGN
jgi:hypothetical protein